MADKILRCPRCGTLTPISKGECQGCGLKMIRKKKSKAAPEAESPETPPAENRTPAPPSSPKPAAQQPPADNGPMLEISDDKTGIMPKLKLGGDDPEESMPTLGLSDEPAPEASENAEEAGAQADEDDGGMKDFLMGTSMSDDEPGPDADEEETPAADWIMGTHDHDDGTEPAPEPEPVDDNYMPKLSLQDVGEEYPEEEPVQESYDDYGMVGGEEFGSEDQSNLDLADIGPSGMPGEIDGMPDQKIDINSIHVHEAKPRKRGPSPTEIVNAYRKRTAKRRYFTRVIPLLVLGIVLWRVGEGYLISYFVAQGNWSGTISDHDVELNQRTITFNLDLDRRGRRIVGSFDLQYPKLENGKMNKAKTPTIVQESFTGSRGAVIGEFDLGKARFKLYNSDPDIAMEFSGEIRRNDERHMIIKAEAINCNDTRASIMITRNSLY